MTNSLHLLVAALCLPAAVAAQDRAALTRLLRESFTGVGPEHAPEFVTLARWQGLVRDDEQAAVAKEMYQAFVDPNREAAGSTHLFTPMPTASTGGVAPAGAVDLESNDTIGFADELDLSTGSCTVSGSIGAGDARDVYRFALTGETQMTLTATAAATPTNLLVFDAVGRLVIVGLTRVAGMREVRDVCLPAGTYYVSVVATNYTLNVTASASACPTLVAGGNADTINPGALPTDSEAVRSWKFVVPSGFADVQLAVATTASTPTDHNIFFNLARANGGRIHFCDDVFPAPAHANDPVMTAGLPAGTYYVYVQNAIPGVTSAIPYTLTLTQTPSTPRQLCGSTNYTFANSGDRHLFQLTLNATDHVSIQTRLGAVPPPSPDSYIELFDADMGMLMHNDDGCPTAGCGFLSWIDCTLPAGTYYLTFRGFANGGSSGELGDYLIVGTCNQTVTTTPLEAVRTGPVAIPAGSHRCWTYQACTDSPIQVDHTEGLHVLGSDGKLRASYQQLLSPGSISLVGTSVQANETLFLIQRTATGAATTASHLALSGKLGIELSPVSATGTYSLRSQDKVGRLQALFLSVGAGPQVPIAPFDGLLCLQPATLTFVGFATMSNSTMTWPLPDLRPYLAPAFLPGLRFQALSFDANLQGGFTNLAP